MIRATISELKNGLSAYLRRVRSGETVLVLDRKTPVARLVPAGFGAEAREQHALYETEAVKELANEAKLARLERAGIVVRNRATEPLDIIRAWQPLEDARLVEAVIEERDEEYHKGYR